jgi:hypothetical protein
MPKHCLRETKAQISSHQFNFPKVLQLEEKFALRFDILDLHDHHPSPESMHDLLGFLDYHNDLDLHLDFDESEKASEAAALLVQHDDL